jgi:hypothetical protein
MTSKPDRKPPPRRGITVPDDVGTGDFASDIQGRASLKGDDQDNVHTERQRVPDAVREAEDVVESFEITDRRSRRDGT